MGTRQVRLAPNCRFCSDRGNFNHLQSFRDGYINWVEPSWSRPITRANHALDAANFFLADVRDALGPYLAVYLHLAVYLLTERQWDEESIGFVMSVATIAGIAAQTPAGALVDATTAKRGLMAAAALSSLQGRRSLFLGFRRSGR